MIQYNNVSNQTDITSEIKISASNINTCVAYLVDGRCSCDVLNRKFSGFISFRVYWTLFSLIKLSTILIICIINDVRVEFNI